MLMQESRSFSTSSTKQPPKVNRFKMIKSEHKKPYNSSKPVKGTLDDISALINIEKSLHTREVENIVKQTELFRDYMRGIN